MEGGLDSEWHCNYELPLPWWGNGSTLVLLTGINRRFFVLFFNWLLNIQLTFQTIKNDAFIWSSLHPCDCDSFISPSRHHLQYLNKISDAFGGVYVSAIEMTLVWQPIFQKISVTSDDTLFNSTHLPPPDSGDVAKPLKLSWQFQFVHISIVASPCKHSINEV